MSSFSRYRRHLFLRLFLLVAAACLLVSRGVDATATLQRRGSKPTFLSSLLAGKKNRRRRRGFRRFIILSVTLTGGNVEVLTETEEQSRIQDLIVDSFNSINCPEGFENCDALFLTNARFIRSTTVDRPRRLHEGATTTTMNHVATVSSSQQEQQQDRRILEGEICFLEWLYELLANCDNCDPDDPIFPDNAPALVGSSPFLQALSSGLGNTDFMTFGGTTASLVPTSVREVSLREIKKQQRARVPLFRLRKSAKTTTTTSVSPRQEQEQQLLPAPAFCFSGLDMVTTPQGQVPLKDLNIGDLVSNGIHFEQVYSFGHYLPASSKTLPNNAFLNIYTTNNAFSPALTVSKDHLIFIHNKNKNNKDPLVLPASHIKVGDQLLVQTSATTSTPTALFVPTVVSRIEDVNDVPQGGIFAPFTPSGRILVNGILASNYVAHLDNNNNNNNNNNDGMLRLLFSFDVIDWLSHLFMTPRRLVCEINFEWCRNESYTNEGISTWVVPLRSFGKWFFGGESQNDDGDGVSFVMRIQSMMMIFVKWMILMSIVGIMGVLRLLELYPSTMVVLGMTTTALWLIQTHKAKKGKE